MISTINPESILNIIKNQFFSIIRREKDTFGNINIDISLERQYIQYEESVENTIYIVVSLKPSDIILKQIVQPLEIFFIFNKASPFNRLAFLFPLESLLLSHLLILLSL